MDDAQRIETVKRYVRRTYAGNVAGLKTLSEKIFNGLGATEAVTITGQTFEGGSSQGTITFEPIAYLKAVEDIIAEFDSTVAPEAPNYAYARFSAGSSS